MNREKQALYNKCVEHTEARILAIENALASVSESKNSETKSSAGDKYETGRAMMQQEEDRNRSQLFQARQLASTLKRIDLHSVSKKVSLGSLVLTSRGVYFMSIGLGKVLLENDSYYCVSIESPIGSKLAGRVEGDEVQFNGNNLRINSIL